MKPIELNKTVSILGCGWYGLEVAKNLVAKGFLVRGSTTSPEKLSVLEQYGIRPYLLDFSAGAAHYDPEFFESDILIIALPPKRTAGEHKEYPGKIRRIAEAALQGRIKNVLMISSTSVYADVNREVSEADRPMPGTASGEAILQGEEILKSYGDFKITILRFGGLIGPGRNLGKFFAGRKDIENGLAPVNLLHLDDSVQLTLHVIDNRSFGYTFNACSPDHPSRKEFYSMVTKLTDLAEPHFKEELDDWKRINADLVCLLLNYKYLVSNWSEFLSPHKL